MTTTATAPAPAPAPRRAPGRRSTFSRVLGRQPLGIVFAAPYAIFLAAVFAYPLGLAVWISFPDYFFTAPGATVDRPFVGFDNYATVLSDPDVRRSFYNVAIFLVINVPLTVVLALLLANALNAAIRGRTFFRSSFYVPYVTASVACVAVWLFLFSEGGMVNQVLGKFAPDPSWLVNSTLAMPFIAVFVTWKQLGLYILLYLAALQNVGKELYEAASVDGAGPLARFRNVTWPGVRPATTLVVVLAIITGSNLFTEPYLMTGGGGPNGASSSPVLIMYQTGIQQGNAGAAAALGVILVIFVAVVGLIARRLSEGSS
jgi:multiple sugar transport system permease protein